MRGAQGTSLRGWPAGTFGFMPKCAEPPYSESGLGRLANVDRATIPVEIYFSRGWTIQDERIDMQIGLIPFFS